MLPSVSKIKIQNYGAKITNAHPVFQALFFETHFVSVALPACLSRLDAIKDGIGVSWLGWRRMLFVRELCVRPACGAWV